MRKICNLASEFHIFKFVGWEIYISYEFKMLSLKWLQSLSQRWDIRHSICLRPFFEQFNSLNSLDF